jgi:hypothetical protein
MKLKQGSKVRVKKPSYYNWPDEMDFYVGKDLIITELSFSNYWFMVSENPGNLRYWLRADWITKTELPATTPCNCKWAHCRNKVKI